MKIENSNYIKSDKFTTVEIYISLLKEFDYSKPYYPLLLSYILNGSSENYPTKDKLSKKIYSLYNANVEISIRAQYECQITSLYISCLNPKYVNDNTLIHDCIELGHELLYKPFLNKNKDGFDENIFEEKKKRVIIPGSQMKFIKFIMRFISDKALLKMVYRTQRRKRK